jgi:2-methylcitrate dehydratase PrpD
VTAALLAQAGFGGPEDALECHGGLLGAFGDARTDAATLADGLGTRFAVTETQIKAYACCAFLQPAVNAVIDLHGAHGVRPDDIEQIALHFPKGGASVIDNNPVRSHNAQYVLAVALHDLDVTFDDLTVDRRKAEPDLAALSEKVQVVYSEPLDPEFPARYTSRVVIDLRDGRQVESLVTYPKGHPNNALTAAELRAKFSRLVVPVVGESTAQALVAELDGIEATASIEALAALLRTEPAREAVGVAAGAGASR